MLLETLSTRASESYSWLVQVLAQLNGEAPWTLDLGNDPMATIKAIDGMRGDFEQAGVGGPVAVDPDADPMGNVIAWRDFLAAVRTVN